MTSKQRLNITNGDSAAGTMSEAGVEGKIIAWRDVLHEGPVDSSLSLEELSKQRARFIASNNWDDFAHISGDFSDRDRVIRQLDYFDEVVLWFEDDLYDQLQLIQLLDFFSRRDVGTSHDNSLGFSCSGSRSAGGGLATRLGRPGCRLSGGRACLAESARSHYQR